MIAWLGPARAAGAWQALVEFLVRYADHLFVIAAPALVALVRALGTTIESGQTGLRFTCGRAGRTLEPGFHPLIPLLQHARRLPTRSRTLDLPAQRVVSPAGLVWIADANLVYEVVDVRRALIEVDVLERGMTHMLALGVQQVLRGLQRDDLAAAGRLDEALRENLARRLERWGVRVERAGFTSITPSQRTLRLTQLAEVTLERRRRLAHLEQRGTPRSIALSLLGTRARAWGRGRRLRGVDHEHRRLRRQRAVLQRAGWTKVQIKLAGRRLRERIGTGGHLRGKAANGRLRGRAAGQRAGPTAQGGEPR